MKEGSVRPLGVRRLGRVPYRDGLALQDELVRARRTGDIHDTLLLVEHPHVITMGTAGDWAHVVSDEAERERLGIEVFEAGRGGDVTYHGPGQLVAYPILDLKPDRQDLHRYLRDLEDVLIRVARDFGLEAGRREGKTGAWTALGKLAAIGVRVSSGWITSHGVALNVHTDLRYFETIVPCGITDESVTSLERELGRPVTLEEASLSLEKAFATVFERRIVVV